LEKGDKRAGKGKREKIRGWKGMETGDDLDPTGLTIIISPHRMHTVQIRGLLLQM